MLFLPINLILHILQFTPSQSSIFYLHASNIFLHLLISDELEYQHEVELLE